VLGNTIRTSGDDGIVATDWNIINNNFVYTTTDDGIYLQGVETVCIGNRVETADVGIRIKLNEANNSVQSNSIFSAVTDSIVDLGIDSIINNNPGYNHNSLFPFYEQNTAPTINDNCTAYWYDLDDDYMYQITNSYGSVWYVNMTKTI